MDGKNESAGRRSVEARDLVVGDELNAMDDAAFLIQIDEVVGGETGHGRHAFEWLEPEAGVGVGCEAFDENLDGLQGIGACVDDGDARAD
jgi:hypothetical protein